MKKEREERERPKMKEIKMKIQPKKMWKTYLKVCIKICLFWEHPISRYGRYEYRKTKKFSKRKRKKRERIKYNNNERKIKFV